MATEITVLSIHAIMKNTKDDYQDECDELRRRHLNSCTIKQASNYLLASYIYVHNIRGQYISNG